KRAEIVAYRSSTRHRLLPLRPSGRRVRRHLVCAPTPWAARGPLEHFCQQKSGLAPTRTCDRLRTKDQYSGRELQKQGSGGNVQLTGKRGAGPATSGPTGEKQGAGGGAASRRRKSRGRGELRRAALGPVRAVERARESFSSVPRKAEPRAL